MLYPLIGYLSKQLIALDLSHTITDIFAHCVHMSHKGPYLLCSNILLLYICIFVYYHIMFLQLSNLIFVFSCFVGFLYFAALTPASKQNKFLVHTYLVNRI